MDADEDAENVGYENIPSTVEEMRQKRLAYFNAGGTKKTVSEWEIQNPFSSTEPTAGINSTESHLEHQNDSNVFQTQDLRLESQGLYGNVTPTQPVNKHDHLLVSTTLSNNMIVDNSSSVAMNHFPSNDKCKIENPQLSRQEPQYSSSRLEYLNKEPQPLRSRKGKFVYKSIDSDVSQLQLNESKDTNGFSVFSSHTDLGELGLSTHRPESETSARVIQGELFIPTSHGSGKTTKQIFSEKIEQEMRTALGDEKMKELMTKVNNDIGQLHQQNRSPLRMQKYEDSKLIKHDQTAAGLSRSFSHDSFNPVVLTNNKSISTGNNRTRAGSQSPQRHPVSKAPLNFQEGEREVHTLVRNYDQITVPKNTRNSYSSEEIYRQAYGGFQENSGGVPLRQWSNSYPDYSSQPENRPYALANGGRKSNEVNSHIATSSPSHTQNYTNVYSFPPPPLSSQVFDSQVHNNVPLNHHASYIGQTGSIPMLMPNAYPYPRTFYPETSGNSPHHYGPFISQSPSTSPNTVSTSNPFFYPTPPFSSHFGVPRFQDNVAYHINPAPPYSHQPIKQTHSQVPFEHMARRHSFTFHGNQGDEVSSRMDFVE